MQLFTFIRATFVASQQGNYIALFGKLNLDAREKRIKGAIPYGYSLAKRKHLIDIKNMSQIPEVEYIVALGETGPNGYSGNPTLVGKTTNRSAVGDIYSMGIDIPSMKFSAGTTILFVLPVTDEERGKIKMLTYSREYLFRQANNDNLHKENQPALSVPKYEGCRFTLRCPFTEVPGNFEDEKIVYVGHIKESKIAYHTVNQLNLYKRLSKVFEKM